MSGEIEKVNALSKIANSQLLTLLCVSIFLGSIVFLQHKERQKEMVRQEKITDHLFERSNEVIEKNTKAFEKSSDAFNDQKEVITELKILIQTKKQ